MINNSFETIMKRMLSRIPSTLDKREGSVIWDALAPVALEIESLYFLVKGVEQENNVLICSRPYLILKAIERGLSPFQGNKSKIKVEFNVDFEFNDVTPTRLHYQNIPFKVIKRESDRIYILECEEQGIIGNISSGNLVPITPINGYKTNEIKEIVLYGREEEDTESFRKRYLESFTELSFGGNISDYKNKTLSISGVGAVKVIPTLNGLGGHVGLVILNSEFGIANTELINSVKEIIDPEKYSGMGYGYAPIGHKVTVSTIQEEDITIKIKCVFTENDNFTNRKEKIKEIIEKHLLELKKQWSTVDNVTIKHLILQAKLLEEIPTISDITVFKINDRTNNYSLAQNKIPKLKDVIEYA